MSQPKNLAEVGVGEFQKFLDSFDTILCDCDGVLILLNTAIEGSTEVLKKLKNLGKRVNYVTNNCVRTRKEFVQLLIDGGFNLTQDEIIMPTIAIIDYLKDINFNSKLFVLSFNGLKQDLRDAGFKLADTGPSEIEEDAAAIIGALFDDQDGDVGAIIVDVDMTVNYIRLQKAIFHLRDPKVLFIAAAQDDLIIVRKNIHLIGPQYFQNIIKTISGRDPMAFGKPGRHLIDFVKRKFNVNPSKTLFIGDTFSDMIFANDAGYQKLLVLSGVASAEDLQKCTDAKLLPDYYANSLGDLNGLLDQISKPKEMNSSL